MASGRTLKRRRQRLAARTREDQKPTLLTPDWITKEALRIMTNTLSFASLVNRPMNVTGRAFELPIKLR